MPIFYRRGCATTATCSFCLNAIGTPTRTGVRPGLYRSDGPLRKNRGSIILHERPHGTDAYMGWAGGGCNSDSDRTPRKNENDMLDDGRALSLDHGRDVYVDPAIVRLCLEVVSIGTPRFKDLYGDACRLSGPMRCRGSSLYAGNETSEESLVITSWSFT